MGMPGPIGCSLMLDSAPPLGATEPIKRRKACGGAGWSWTVQTPRSIPLVAQFPSVGRVKRGIGPIPG
jgi:hypothetical protein